MAMISLWIGGILASFRRLLGAPGADRPANQARWAMLALAVIVLAALIIRGVWEVWQYLSR